MERNKKKSAPRIVVVRNPEAPKPKTVVIRGSGETAVTKLSKSLAWCNVKESGAASQPKPATSKSTPNIELNSALKTKERIKSLGNVKPTCPNKNPTADSSSKPDFDHPELNSALRIKERIKSLESLKPKKVADKKCLPITEEAAKQVNFPLDKPVFKGLVPLGVVKEKEIVPERHYVRRPREKEPVLSDFYTPTTFPEEPVLPPLQKPEFGKMHAGFDRLRLYKIMQTWNDDDMV